MRIGNINRIRKKFLLRNKQVLFILFFVVLMLSIKINAPSDKNPVADVVMMIHQGNHIKIPKHSPLRAKMTIKSVSATNALHLVTLPGIIEAPPVRTVSILPPLTGRLTTINVNLGDFVKKNQLLAEISSPDLAQASADNEKANDALYFATDALNRAKRVNHAGGIAIKDLQQAQSNYNQAQTEAKRAKDRLETLDNNGFSLLPIKAPIPGRITAINYGIGSYITDPTAVLMIVSDLTSVWVNANVPENLVGSITKNQAVDVVLPAYPDKHLKSRISFVDAMLDPNTHRNKTRIILPNLNGALQPNMYATVQITVPEPFHIALPTSAILMNDDSTTVFVETAPWVFERRPVTLGPEDKNQVWVLSGLTSGDRVVLDGGIFIND